MLTKVQEAKNKNSEAGVIDKVSVEVLASYGEDGKIDFQKLKNNLENISDIEGVPEEIKESDFPLNVKVNKYEVSIEKEGKVKAIKTIGIGDTAVNGNCKYKSDGKVAIIPNGFKVSDKIGEYNIDEGLVVIAPDKSEFAWIPVESKLEKLEGTKDEYVEPKDFNEIETQIYKYGGFYIGRYETSVAEENGTTSVRVKRDEWPKVSLTKQEAKECSNKYMSNEYVQSNLIYGLEWDRVLKLFIEKKLLNIEGLNNSKDYGNYSDSAFKFSGDYKVYEKWSLIDTIETIENNEKRKSLSDGYGYLIKTGKTESSKLYNIYDMAGNVAEWTMEGFKSGINDNIYRGGYCLVNGTESIKYRNEGTKDVWTNEFVGFRTCLYLK